MSFLLKRSGFTLILILSSFTILFGYQNCGKVRFDRDEKVNPTCTEAEILAGTCGITCRWSGDKNVSASPTSFTGTGTVSGVVSFTVPENDAEIESVIFNFDDGTTPVTVVGDDQVVQHTFTSATTQEYQVQVAVKKVGDQNCVHLQTIIITINTSDNCLISTTLGGDNTGVVGEQLDFLVSMTSCPNNGYTVNWDYNNDGVVDATLANNPAGRNAWSTPGQYRVKANTVFASLGINSISEKDVIISCPFGSYQNTGKQCICHSTGQQLPDNGVCPPCGVGSTQDPTTGACSCPTGQAYDPADRRCECPSGNLPVNGQCGDLQCTITINGQEITRNEGQSLTLHRRDNAGTVSCGFTCSSQSRTCRSGQFVNAQNQPQPFDPNYIYSELPACQNACGSCSLPVADGTLTANAGDTRTVYQRPPSVATCGFTCSGQNLTCNGSQFINASQQPVTNGSALYIGQPACTNACQTCSVTNYPGITSLNVGQSLTKYTTSGVACGANACAGQTLTCNTAGQTLTFGSQYTYTDANSCRNNIPACPLACSVSGYPGVTSLAAGQSLTGYTSSGVACESNSCSAISRTCPSTGGVALIFPTGTQTTNASCVGTIPACPPTDYIDVHFSKTNNDYTFSQPASTIRVTDTTYSYIKLRTGVRNIRICHNINGTPTCNSDSHYFPVTITPVGGSNYSFVGSQGSCGGGPVQAVLYTGQSGYDIFKITNGPGCIGTYGDQMLSYGKQGTAIDSFAYSVEAQPLPDAELYISNVANPSSNVTNFTQGTTVYMLGLNVNGAQRAQGCITYSTTDSNLSTCSNFTTLGTDWSCSGTTCTQSSNTYPVGHYRGCLRNPNTNSVACTPTFHVNAPLAPEPTMRGCFVDTHAWDSPNNTGACFSNGCTATNDIVYSVGTKRVADNQGHGRGDHFTFDDPSLYAITWTGECTGNSFVCITQDRPNGNYVANVTVRRLSDNETWSYSITGRKQTRFSMHPNDCPPIP